MASSFLLPLLILSLFLAAFTSPFAVPQPDTARGSTVLIERQTNWTVGQIVNTTSGPIQGTASTLRPDVSVYLGIPFAQPPTGDLRFAAPVAVTQSSSVINATTVFKSGGVDFLVAVSQHGDVLSEDCLSVNVWTKPQTGESKKAVLFWVFGGGFGIGNAVNKAYDGSALADANDVVVVSANYRTNIFGFSGAPNATQNVGLLDQRLAMEWTQNNIGAFGGDPTRITLFGQSAGGASVDYITYSYIDDPITHGVILQSGVANAVFASSSASIVTDNWYTVSTKLGCGGEDAGEETVTCMREQSVDDILSALTAVSNVSIASGFVPVADNITVPSDISERLSDGDFAKIPVLTGNTDNEAGFFLALWIAYTNITEAQIAAQPVWFITLVDTVLNVITTIGFACAVIDSAAGRVDSGVPAWKYTYYGGNYTNTYIPYVGSNYHTAELPILFGTAESLSNEPDSAPEASQEQYMRQAWAAFARDPQNGLSDEMDWPEYSTTYPQVVRISYESETAPDVIVDYGTPLECDTISTGEDIGSAILSALTPFEDLLSPVFSVIQDILSGTSLPAVNTSSGSTFDLLLSLLEFVVEVIPK